MANIPIGHAKVAVDYPGGIPTVSETLYAADWNQTHFTVSSGSGILVTSDGGTPPILTFSVTSTEPTATTFGGNIIPTQDATFDIGSTALRWQNGYFAGTVSVGTLAYTTLNPAAGGGLSGGTTNAIPLWASATTLTNSIMGQSGTTVSVGGALNALTTVSAGGQFITQASGATSGILLGYDSLGGIGQNGRYTIYSDQTGIYLETSNASNATSNIYISQGGNKRIWLFDQSNSGAIRPATDQGTNLGTTAFRWATVYTQAVYSGNIDLELRGNLAVTVTSALNPTVDNTYGFGTSTKRWASGYFSGTVSTGGQFQTSPLGATSGILLGSTNVGGYNGQNSNYSIYSDGTGIYIETANASSAVANVYISQGGSIRLWLYDAAAGGIRPNADDASNLGSSSFRWASVYTTHINAGTSDLTIRPNGAVVPDADNQRNIGTSSIRWNNIIAMTHSAATAFTTNTSAGMQFGDGALAGNSAALGAIADKIVVMVNGVARVIPVYVS